MPEPEWQEDDLSRLVQSAIRGDVEAFGQLYETYALQVFRFLYAHLDDRLDAEDLTGEVFLKVWRALPNYRAGGAPFVGYLFRIARNTLIDFYRRTRRKPRHVLLREDQIANPDSDPAVSLPVGQEQAEIRRALASLREDYRSVITLRFFAGLSPGETAAAMGKTPGAIRVLQHRALAALRKLLEDQI